MRMRFVIGAGRAVRQAILLGAGTLQAALGTPQGSADRCRPPAQFRGRGTYRFDKWHSRLERFPGLQFQRKILPRTPYKSKSCGVGQGTPQPGPTIGAHARKRGYLIRHNEGSSEMIDTRSRLASCCQCLRAGPC